MAAVKQDTAVERFTMREWEQINAALQYAAGDGLEVSPSLLKRFGRDFEPAPQLLGQAADLIELFVACRFAPGPVTVSIDGPQASGKTVLTAAITHALRTVQVPVHVYGSDPFEPGVNPTFTLIDDVAETMARAGGIEQQKRRRQMLDTYYGREPAPEIITVLPVTWKARARRALGRLMAALRSLRR